MSQMPQGFDIQEIINRMRQQQGAANAANEGRYAQGLGLHQRAQALTQSQLNETGQVYANRARDVNSLLEGIGTSARTRAARATREGIAQDQQSLMSRGLFNTTVLDSLRGQRQRDLEDQNQAIDESTRTARAGAMERTLGDLGGFMERRNIRETGLLQDEAGFMERRTDAAPDENQMLALLREYAAGLGSQAGQAGQGVGRAYSFGGINRGGGGGGGGAGGGAAGGGSTFGSGASGGGGPSTAGIDTVRGTGTAAAYDPRRPITITGLGRFATREALENYYRRSASRPPVLQRG